MTSKTSSFTSDSTMKVGGFDTIKDFDLETCLDLGFFKKTIREFRKVDDNIVPKLNALTTRSSNLEQSCFQFYKELDSAFRQREKLVGRCIKIIDQSIEQKRAQLETQKDLTTAQQNVLRQSLRVAETQQQQIHAEYTVESIVRERTLNVFHSRCRSVKLDPEFGNVRKGL